jgi:transcription-repair coupling factor (superfamily II helicase)
MMEEAVQQLRGQQRHTKVEPEIQLGFPAYVPGSYIPDENQRLAFYRRLAEVTSSEELDEVAVELRERYGPIPALVDSFLRVMDLRRTLKAYMVVRATKRKQLVNLQFHPEAPVDVDQLIALVARDRERFRLSADFQLSFVPRSDDWDGMVSDIQSVLRELREKPSADDGRAPEETRTHG